MSADSLLYDPEIEKTVKQLRKEARSRRTQATGSETLAHEPTENIVDIEFGAGIEMAEDAQVPPGGQAIIQPERTLRDLAAPPVAQQPLCI